MLPGLSCDPGAKQCVQPAATLVGLQVVEFPVAAPRVVAVPAVA